MQSDESLIGTIFTHLFILAIGLVFVLPAGWKLYSYCSFAIIARPVEGIVEKSGIGQYLGSKPYIKYSGAQGMHYEFKSKINYYLFFAPKKGDSIDILVLEDSPGVAIIDSYSHYIIIPLLMIAVGLAIIVHLIVQFLQFIGLDGNPYSDNSA